MGYILMIAISVLIVFIGLYVLLWPQNFKQKISKRNNIEIRALGILVIILGLLFYTIYVCFRANYKLLLLINKSLSQNCNKEDTNSIKSNGSIINDGNTAVYYDMNLPDNDVNESQ